MPEKLTALVTGASRGLGLETCRQLLDRGISVILAARTEEAVGQGLQSLGDNPDAAGAVLDISDGNAVDRFMEKYWQDQARLDILVNNAARIYSRTGSSIGITTPDTLLEALNNNSVGAYRLIRHVLPVMNRHGFGRIVNVSTGMAGLSDMGGGSVAYRVSKTALNAITRVAHAEAGRNVKVNSVCPGWVRTDMGGASAPRAIAEGASGIVWAATLPDTGPSGGFFRDARPVGW
jgi:NAD(P)-dependent dehydrogenase (short-subunit alcohol dehydrogenase family)